VLRPRGDVAAVAVFDETMTGSAVLLSGAERVGEFRMNQTAANLSGPRLFKTVNIYRFTAETLRTTLVPELDSLIAAGNPKAYIEQFLAPLVTRQRLDLHAAVCDDVRWFEIDNESDLRIAETIFRPVPQHAIPEVSSWTPAPAI